MAEKTDDVDCRTMTEFYTDAARYWKGIPSTVDGMLGGFGQLSLTDAISSKQFLKRLFQNSSSPLQAGRALDCGAGIGRVSKMVLLTLFKEVDLLEQNPAFLEKAKTYLGTDSIRIGHYYAIGMQEFEPEAGRYDLIWIQWCMGHLTDDDVVKFLFRCKKGLNPAGGLIGIKENITSNCENIFDEEDSSYTRCLPSILTLVKKAGLTVIQQQDQTDFPDSIYAVKMYALVPEERTQIPVATEVNGHLP